MKIKYNMFSSEPSSLMQYMKCCQAIFLLTADKHNGKGSNEAYLVTSAVLIRPWIRHLYAPLDQFFRRIEEERFN